MAIKKKKVEKKKERSDEQIKNLAIDIRGGAVFGDWMIPEHDKDLVTHIFMPLIFMEENQIDKMISEETIHFYEYNRLAGPRSINGYPMFMSFHTLTKSETERLMDTMEKIEKALDGI